MAAAAAANPTFRGWSASAAALAAACLLLCLLYAVDTLMVSATVHWYQHNPSSGQLMLLAELGKLVIAVVLAVATSAPSSSSSSSSMESANSCLRPCSSGTSTPASSPSRSSHRSSDSVSEVGSRSSSSSSSSSSCVHVTINLQQPEDAVCLLGQHTPTAAKAAAAASAAVEPAKTFLQRVQQRLQRRDWLSGLLHFGFPAVCYCVSNNLSFYALRLLPAYTYMLLTSPKMIMTALVRASFLGQPIPQHQQLAYVAMLLAVNLGTPGGATPAADSPHVQYNVPAGVLVMLGVAACSALATVYTEWVMNHSCYSSESIHQQNAKLYAAGIVLNGGYFLVHGAAQGRGQGLWTHMYPLHWGIEVVLATMGLLVSAIIKYLGSGVKVLASAAAMFASGWASHLFLGEQPPALFWLGALLAAGALVWHHAGWSWSAESDPTPASASKGNTTSSSISSGDVSKGTPDHPPVSPKQGAPLLLWVTLVGAVAMAVFMSASGSNTISSSTSWQHQSDLPGAATNISGSTPLLSSFPRNSSLLIPTKWLPIDSLGSAEVCTPVACSFDLKCTPDNPKCCIFYHRRLLGLMSAFWAHHGLSKDWFAVYGTLIGAIRQPGGILPWTNDIDLGVSPRLVATLERPDVRDELWGYGVYVYFDVLWKVCVHARHPDPVWQDGFVKPVFLTDATPQQPQRQRARDWLFQGQQQRPPAYQLAHLPTMYNNSIDLWPAAPLEADPRGTYFKCDPCPDPALPSNKHLWHLWSSTGWLQVTFTRRASVAGVWVTIPDNAEEHAALVYGQYWRVPNYKYHGKWAEDTVAWAPRKGLFAGSRLAITQEKAQQQQMDKLFASRMEMAKDLTARQQQQLQQQKQQQKQQGDVHQGTSGSGAYDAGSHQQPAEQHQQQPTITTAHGAGPLEASTTQALVEGHQGQQTPPVAGPVEASTTQVLVEGQPQQQQTIKTTGGPHDASKPQQLLAEGQSQQQPGAAASQDAGQGNRLHQGQQHKAAAASKHEAGQRMQPADRAQLGKHHAAAQHKQHHHHHHHAQQPAAPGSQHGPRQPVAQGQGRAVEVSKQGQQQGVGQQLVAAIGH